MANLISVIFFPKLNMHAQVIIAMNCYFELCLSYTHHCLQVVVEGNIGVGKSTFLEHLQKNSQDVEIYAEPVALWKDIGGFNALVSKYPHITIHLQGIPFDLISVFQQVILIRLLLVWLPFQSSRFRCWMQQLFSLKHYALRRVGTIDFFWRFSATDSGMWMTLR